MSFNDGMDVVAPRLRQKAKFNPVPFSRAWRDCPPLQQSRKEKGRHKTPFVSRRLA
ncbi:hypothetical protein GCM10010991_03710 [Gemmobacter aquaticus]|uniref:Uncharacterized protein n=1 Tax=Gemmobacter aquaticus TaxID=490185 RepID=A0A917YHC5_9RHOB|nr:hypothetical protein GCM10010991_03710 [Gemmobacter aquaticus]